VSASLANAPGGSARRLRGQLRELPLVRDTTPAVRDERRELALSNLVVRHGDPSVLSDVRCLLEARIVEEVRLRIAPEVDRPVAPDSC
jgi:hypothetical protein